MWWRIAGVREVWQGMAATTVPQQHQFYAFRVRIGILVLLSPQKFSFMFHQKTSTHITTFQTFSSFQVFQYVNQLNHVKSHAFQKLMDAFFTSSLKPPVLNHILCQWSGGTRPRTRSSEINCWVNTKRDLPWVVCVPWALLLCSRNFVSKKREEMDLVNKSWVSRLLVGSCSFRSAFFGVVGHQLQAVYITVHVHRTETMIQSFIQSK